jgi:organic radical activating enzyme
LQKPKRYRVKEIFGPTIQGEGTHTGLKVLFLRLSGCNKWSGRPEHKPKSICNYCDTDFVGGDMMEAGDIVRHLQRLGDTVDLVISGGEPALQIDKELLLALVGAGFRLHLETNGSKDIGELANFFYHITMSPKQGREGTLLKRCDDLKLLFPYIDSEITIEKFISFEHRYAYLQPVWDDNYKFNLNSTIDKIMEMNNWKLSLQTHKITGVV